MPCPTLLPKSLPGLQQPLGCCGWRLPGRNLAGTETGDPQLGSQLEGRMDGCSRTAAAPKHGLRRIPAGTHPAGPAAPPATTSKSTHQHRRPPGGLSGKKDFFIKRKKNPEGFPLQPPLGGSLRLHSSPPSPTRAFHDFPPPGHCGKKCRAPSSPRPAARVPQPRGARPAAGTDRQRRALGCAHRSRRRRARAVLVAERSSLASSCLLTARRHRPRVPACHGHGHIPPPVPRQTSAGCSRGSGAR